MRPGPVNSVPLWASATLHHVLGKQPLFGHNQHARSVHADLHITHSAALAHHTQALLAVPSSLPRFSPIPILLPQQTASKIVVAFEPVGASEKGKNLGYPNKQAPIQHHPSSCSGITPPPACPLRRSRVHGHACALLRPQRRRALNTCGRFSRHTPEPALQCRLRGDNTCLPRTVCTCPDPVRATRAPRHALSCTRRTHSRAHGTRAPAGCARLGPSPRQHPLQQLLGPPPAAVPSRHSWSASGCPARCGNPSRESALRQIVRAHIPEELTQQ